MNKKNLQPHLSKVQLLDWYAQDGLLYKHIKNISKDIHCDQIKLWKVANKFANLHRDNVLKCITGDDLSLLNEMQSKNFVAAKILYWLYEYDGGLIHDNSWLSAYYTEILCYRKKNILSNSYESEIIRSIFNIFIAGDPIIKLKKIGNKLPHITEEYIAIQLDLSWQAIEKKRFAHYHYNICSNYLIFIALLKRYKSLADELFTRYAFDLRYYPWNFIHQDLTRALKILRSL